MNSLSQGFIRPTPEGGSKGTIKSRQDGTLTMSTASQTVTISTVDTTKAIVKCWSFGGTFPDSIQVKGVLTDKNTITFSRTTASGTNQIYWVVIEYYNLKSLQTGTYTYNSTGEKTVTISPIDKNKVDLITSFTTTVGTSDLSALQLRARIIDSTTLGFQSPMASGQDSIYWQLPEFY